MNNRPSFAQPWRKALALPLLALVALLSLAACSDDEDDPKNNTQPDNEQIEKYDDLAFFQDAIIEVDSLGNMMSRSIGEVLDENDPEHLFIGVDNLAEAEILFRQWIAPDVELTTTVPTQSGLTCPLTDLEGKAQGTIYFTPASGTSVAEVTASSGTKLQYFNRITFLLNSAWPHNTSIYQQYTEGDIITHSPIGLNYSLKDNDVTLKFVCIRQASNGVKPMFVAITNNRYETIDEMATIMNSDYCPATGKANIISSKLSASWEFYVQKFKEAGCGQLNAGTGYWIDNVHGFFQTFYDYIYLKSGAIYGSKYREKEWPFILKIDWLDDDAIKTNLVATAGSRGVSEDEYYYGLFDNNPSTKWCTHVNQKQNGYWYVEFQANAPIYVTGYRMTTALESAKYNNRSPKSWKLYGRNDPSQQWRQIDEKKNEKWIDFPFITHTYTLDKPGNYMYFRLEVTENAGAEVMWFSVFNFITAEPAEED